MNKRLYTSPDTRNIDEMLQRLYQRRLVVENLIELLQEYSRCAPVGSFPRVAPSSAPGTNAAGAILANSAG